MLSIVSLAEQTLTSGAAISFDTNRIVSSCSSRHVAGTPTVNLVRPGYYCVIFNTMATASEAATEPIVVQLFNDDTEISGATATALSTSATSPVNLSFATIIQIRPSCCAVNNTGSLTFRTTGVEATFTEPNVTVFYIE